MKCPKRERERDTFVATRGNELFVCRYVAHSNSSSRPGRGFSASRNTGTSLSMQMRASCFAPIASLMVCKGIWFSRNAFAHHHLPSKYAASTPSNQLRDTSDGLTSSDNPWWMQVLVFASLSTNTSKKKKNVKRDERKPLYHTSKWWWYTWLDDNLTTIYVVSSERSDCLLSCTCSRERFVSPITSVLFNWTYQTNHCLVLLIFLL